MLWEEAVESKQSRVFESNSSGHALTSFYDVVCYWPLGSDNFYYGLGENEYFLLFPVE